MAIGFMPTDEDTEARYERLNRILLELYELVQLINREGPRAPVPPESRSPPSQPRVRPLSDSAAPRLPDLVSGSICPPRRRISSQRSAPSSPSCSAQHHSRTFSDLFHPGQAGHPGEVSAVPQSPLDDEVFFSAPTVRLAQPRQRRRRKRSSSFKDVKKRTKAQTEGSNESWEDEQTRIENTDRGTSANILEQDTVDSSASSGAEKMAEVTESSFVRLGRSLWTAVFLVIGWKLLVNKR